MSLHIHHLDEHIVVVEKPSGMLVHRSQMAPDKHVLMLQLRDQLGRHVYPVHRIDRPASGLVAMALDPESAAGLQRALAQPDAEKRYLALVRGIAPPAGVLDKPLSRKGGGAPQAARTEWERLDVVRGCSLLSVRLHSGRRHQIRRHMAHLRHQLLGDTTYGKGRVNRYFREEFGLERLFLHAAGLRFSHPITGRKLRVASPLDAELASVADRLRQA